MSFAVYTPSPFPCSIAVVQTSGNLGKTFKFERKHWCLLGAHLECDIIVPFAGVAKLQALIYVRKNGVFLQGIDKDIPVKHPRLQKSLRNEEEMLLIPGDEFVLGERKFVIQYSAEDAGLNDYNEGLSSHNQEHSSAKIAARRSKSTTPRADGGGQRRRKNSLIVGEFGEKYVSSKRSSDRLLSNTQLARISQTDIEILPTRDVQHNPDGEHLTSEESSTDASQKADDSADSSSGDDSLGCSGNLDDVSRNIDFSSLEPELRPTESNSPSISDCVVGSEGSASTGAKRDLVFTRLSKGLPATPFRGKKKSSARKPSVSAKKTSTPSRFEAVRALTGKENDPQNVKQSFKDSKQQTGKEEGHRNRVRSPLATRTELENQIEPVVSRKKTPTSKRRIGISRPTHHSANTPTTRSVVFASTIELARGAHYSPFRPRKAATKAKRMPKSPANFTNPEQSPLSDSRFASGSPSCPQKMNGQSVKDHEQGPAPTAQLEQLGTFYYPKEKPDDKLDHQAGFAVEYEDDSDPPTPSSIEETPKTVASDLAGPSPMARVGGALAAFLRRLSGTLESDEDSPTSGRDKMVQYKKVPAGGLQEKGLEMESVSSEPLMSSSELVGLSTSVSPEDRDELVCKIEGAAQDMRKAMQLIPENSDEELSWDSKDAHQDLGSSNLQSADKNDERKTLFPVTGTENLAEELPQGCSSDRSDTVSLDGTLPEVDEIAEKNLHSPSSDGDSDSIDESEGREAEIEKPMGAPLAEVVSAEAIECEAQSIEVPLCSEEDQEQDIPVGENSSNNIILDNCNSTDSSAANDGLKSDSFADRIAGKDAASDKSTEKSVPTNEKWTLAESNLNDDDISTDDHVEEVRDNAFEIILLQKGLSRLKKDELKAKLEQNRLDTSGLKKDLVQRLALHLTQAEPSAAELPTEDNISSPKVPSDEETIPEKKSDSDSITSHVTPRMLRSRRNIAEGISTEDSDSVTRAPSARKAKSKTPSKAPQPQDLSDYRRRTVKELREFLKNRNLEIDQKKMRKEELIQHLISLSIGSDGQSLGDNGTDQAPNSIEESNSEPREQEEPSFTAAEKSYNKMTVIQLRAELKERYQCQAGTKKVLLARISSLPERRTRSKRAANETFCLPCQAGEKCSADSS